MGGIVPTRRRLSLVKVMNNRRVFAIKMLFQ